MVYAPNDVYTIVLTGNAEEHIEYGLTEYTVQGDLYHSPQSLWDGKGKTFHIILIPGLDKLKPDFNKTIKAYIKPSTDNSGKIIDNNFEITEILSIE